MHSHPWLPLSDFRKCPMDVVEQGATRLASLLAKTGRGDLAAFGALHAASAASLLRRAMRIVGNRESAEDVLQESYIAIWREAARFDAARAAPMTWMAAIVRNKAIDVLRANPYRDVLMSIDDGGAALVLDSGAGPCETAELRQSAILIGHGLAGLKQIHRDAIELSFFHELSHGEIAQEMAIPLGTVKTWIRRGCTQMRRHIERARQVPLRARS
jgi:RNA polymerase sigma factor (sigma-70 family)